MSYEKGERVIIHRNQDHTGDVGVFGEVIASCPGAAPGGGDEAQVAYRDPVDGQDRLRRFRSDLLEPATPERLVAMAERHETLAANLRALARDAR